MHDDVTFGYNALNLQFLGKKIIPIQICYVKDLVFVKSKHENAMFVWFQRDRFGFRGAAIIE